MQNPYRDYFSYLLRIWKSDESGQTVWRLSLVDTLGGEPSYFTSLEAMQTYLQGVMACKLLLSSPEAQE
jgi:hypothetical protein